MTPEARGAALLDWCVQRHSPVAAAAAVVVRCHLLLLTALVCRVLQDGYELVLRDVPEVLRFRRGLPLSRRSYVFGVALVQATSSRLLEFKPAISPRKKVSGIESSGVAVASAATAKIGGSVKDCVPRRPFARVTPAAALIFSERLHAVGGALTWPEILPRTWHEFLHRSMEVCMRVVSASKYGPRAHSWLAHHSGRHSASPQPSRPQTVLVASQGLHQLLLHP
jgi:hypothetical protein